MTPLLFRTPNVQPRFFTDDGAADEGAEMSVAIMLLGIRTDANKAARGWQLTKFKLDK